MASRTRSVVSPTLERPVLASHHILLVEDDPLILMTAAETLRSAGFAVVEAETVDAAVDLLRTGSAQIGLILSDIETPGDLDGLALARLADAAWPDIPVVLTSGRVVPPPDALPPAARFVSKPYDLEEVVTLVAALTTR